MEVPPGPVWGRDSLVDGERVRGDTYAGFFFHVFPMFFFEYIRPYCNFHPILGVASTSAMDHHFFDRPWHAIMPWLYFWLPWLCYVSRG